MNKKAILTGLAFIILGGAIAAISWFGFQNTQSKSDIQLLQEFAQEHERARQQLASEPIAIANSCTSTSFSTFERVCENEVYDSEAVIPWNTGINDNDADCVKESYLNTTERFALLNERDFDRSAEVADWQLISHGCSVYGDILLFIDEVDGNSPDLTADTALKAWNEYKQK